MNNKISVIVPIYNGAEHLDDFFQELLSQTHKNLEIICVDDGSTDGSLAILRSYAAANPGRISILTNETNRGTHYSRIRAILASNGEYILWIDGDDELVPNIAKRAYEIAVASHADVISFCGRFSKQAQNEQNRKLTKYKFRKWKSIEILHMMAEGTGSVTMWSKLWRGDMVREVAERLLPFAEKNHIVKHEDGLLHWFFLRAAKTYCKFPYCIYIHKLGRGLAAQKSRNRAFKKKWINDLTNGLRKVLAEENDPRTRYLAEKIFLKYNQGCFPRIFSSPSPKHLDAFAEYLDSYSTYGQEDVLAELKKRSPKFYKAYLSRNRQQSRKKSAEVANLADFG
jgi:glycosyltransferase involved in cell wall biosynthesis